MKVSVIVPTCDRPGGLLALLESLAGQTGLGADVFEVVVVDDGSTEDLRPVVQREWPFALDYHRQSRQGEVVARNCGASAAHGDVLVFLDDDIRVCAEYIGSLLAEHERSPDTIVLGTLFSWFTGEPSPFQRYVLTHERRRMVGGAVPFTECYSGIMSVAREGFFAIGGMLPLDQNGRNAWGGLSFGYRASRLGYGFQRAGTALAWHDDFAAQDVAANCRRWERVAGSAPRLFERYPDLPPHVPMFYDKWPARWGREPIRLSVRKSLRRGSATWLGMAALRSATYVTERIWPNETRLELLYRWVIGAAICRGFRAGLANLDTEDVGTAQARGHSNVLLA